MRKSSRRKEKKQNKAAEKQAQKILAAEIFPVIAGDEKESCFVMENGSFMDMFQINCKDLISASEDIVTFDNYTWDIFYKTYAKDVKIISFNFPADTAKSKFSLGSAPNIRNNLFCNLLGVSSKARYKTLLLETLQSHSGIPSLI